MDKIEALILDYLLNVPSIKDCDDLLDHMACVLDSKVEDEVRTTWNQLTKSTLIHKPQRHWQINSALIDLVKSDLTEELGLHDITALKIKSYFSEIEKSDSLRKLIVLLGEMGTQDDSKKVTFVKEFGWFKEPGPTCDLLVRQRIMFIEPWITVKAQKQYRIYYFRRWPFDSHDILIKVLSL